MRLNFQNFQINNTIVLVISLNPSYRFILYKLFFDTYGNYYKKKLKMNRTYVFYLFNFVTSLLIFVFG